ncbi:MAG TPA: bifunctional phosphopantothenoylcysteine decarboxylase/phosphopantothenate--cysteine ligase CoaBC [Luteibaculaceae bacterium]|nr:bifunctional phosphopantothenoylcysteine decarboxylase/phosphopantothenate--cysteine ligase CoaBC [Luteibaculaceae bacterium]
MSLRGKKIILGVTGSIAAYKSALIVRLLVKEGAEVKVVCTSDALQFVTPLTLSTLSKNPVYSTFVADPETGEWTNHVELGLWADYLLIAPLSANTLYKLVHGQCDNLLTAVYLSAKCPVFLAPAMDLDMYQHPSTAENLSKAKSFGLRVFESPAGELASGLVGPGRMLEPEDVIDNLLKWVSREHQLRGVSVLLTAGPTREKIDPVRFISNYSTGKMGYAIARDLADRGAHVILVTGPTSIELNHPLIEVISVESAREMHTECLAKFERVNAAILAAAVADFRPVATASHKIKKNDASMTIELEPTEDILADLGQRKKDQILIGFALETNNELAHAKAKLERKNLDLIVLNSLNDKGAGFGVDSNKVTLIDRHNNILEGQLKDKSQVASDIVDVLCKLLHANNRS